jgi:hypothetical protein
MIVKGGYPDSLEALKSFDDIFSPGALPGKAIPFHPACMVLWNLREE